MYRCLLLSLLIFLPLKNFAEEIKSADLISNEVTSKNEKEVFKTTLSYFIESERYSDALKLTEKKMKEFPDDQEVIRLNGLSHYLLGNYADAEKSFSKAASISTNEQKSINIYLETQAQIKQGKFESAVDSLRNLEKLPDSKEYAKIAILELKSKRTIPEYNPKSKNMMTSTAQMGGSLNSGRVPSGILSTSLIYGLDTNPIFVPDYSQTKNDAYSTFFSITPSLTLKHSTRYGALSNSFNIGYTDYSREIAKTFNNLRFSLGTEFSPKSEFFLKNKITFTNAISQSYQTQPSLNYYFTQDNLSARKDFDNIGSHSFAAVLMTGFRTYANKNLLDAADDRSGFSYGLKGIHKTSNGDWVWLNSIGGVYQNTFGGKFNTFTTDYGANFQKQVFSSYEFSAGLGVSYINYVNSDNDRKDLMTSFGADIGTELSWIENANFKISFARVANKSKLDASTYTQNIFSAWLNYDL